MQRPLTLLSRLQGRTPANSRHLLLPFQGEPGEVQRKMFDMRISIRLFSVCLGLLLSANMAWAEPNAGVGPASPKSDVNDQTRPDRARRRKLSTWPLRSQTPSIDQSAQNIR